LKIAVCDTEKDRFDFDAAALNRAVDSDALCIIPAHLGGSVANLEPVLEVAKRSGAFVVEDATQSFGAMWRGQSAGTIGEIGFFSLGAGKGLSIYKGGFLFAREPETRAALREMSREIVPSKPFTELARFFGLIGYRIFYNRRGLRFVYGAPLRRHLALGQLERAVGDEVDPNIPIHTVSEVRKRVGACALGRLRDAIAQNAVRAQKRIAELEKIAGVTVVKDLPDSSGVYTFIMVLFDSKGRCDAALAKLWRAGLGVTKLFIHDIADYTFLEQIVPAANVPNARSFAARHLSITNSAWLGDQDFKRILDVIRDCARS
jgi:dTDP-4-amino-4,6-dideoxygalactose transaminase